MTNTAASALPLAAVLPITAGVSAAGHLSLGGCDVRALADEYGTPLYVYDVATLRAQAAAFLRSFRDVYPDCDVLYGSKAFLNRPFARFIADQGLGFDAVSGGEIEVLRAAGVDLSTVYLHGNNKAPWELALAATAGVGRVVIDNEGEVPLLDRVAGEAGVRQRVLVRVSPGIDAHTHRKTTTGIIDSKFGVPIVTGAAERTVAAIAAASNLEFRGLHMHLGSPIFETQPYVEGIEVMAQFIADVCRDRLSLDVPEFSPGGGFAVAYNEEQQAELPMIERYASAVATTLRREADRLGFPLPHITLEPGRAIVARAGVAVYTVGARKEIPGVRTYVSVDGGMADNIRPAMYGAKYQAVAAERPRAPFEETVAIAGKYCESGDVLIESARLPRLHADELLAIPASGAYQLAMESNYNLAYRPAVVMVEDGRARLIRRRQTAEDLWALDVD